MRSGWSQYIRPWNARRVAFSEPLRGWPDQAARSASERSAQGTKKERTACIVSLTPPEDVLTPTNRLGVARAVDGMPGGSPSGTLPGSIDHLPGRPRPALQCRCDGAGASGWSQGQDTGNEQHGRNKERREGARERGMGPILVPDPDLGMGAAFQGHEKDATALWKPRPGPGCPCNLQFAGQATQRVLMGATMRRFRNSKARFIRSLGGHRWLTVLCVEDGYGLEYRVFDRATRRPCMVSFDIYDVDDYIDFIIDRHMEKKGELE